VNVTADNFYAENITFENDFNATHPQLPAGSQALALLVIGDRAVFHNVRLLGNQDTVYAGSRNCSPDGENCIPTRQYFSDCYVAGNVDSSLEIAKRSSIAARSIAQPTPGDTLPHSPSTIPVKTPALSSTGASSPPTPA